MVTSVTSVTYHNMRMTKRRKAIRENEVFRLRGLGLTYRQISQQLKEKHKWIRISSMTAWRIYNGYRKPVVTRQGTKKEPKWEQGMTMIFR